MTSIKPPGGPLPPPDAANLPGADPAAEAAAAAPTEAAQAPAQAPAAGADPIAQLGQEVAAGRVPMAQAVEQLLQQRLGEAAAHLDPAERAALEEMLREALAADPTLQGLASEG